MPVDHSPGHVREWVSVGVEGVIFIPAADGLRFAFYGQVSNEDHQDPESSRGWQFQRTRALTAGRGRIVAE